MNEIYCVVTFNITQHALLFEKLLKENNLKVKLMPVPRQLSASCGTAAYVNCEDKEQIENLCNLKNVPVDCFHEIVSNKKESWFLNRLKR